MLMQFVRSGKSLHIILITYVYVYCGDVMLCGVSSVFIPHEKYGILGKYIC
jgi:hypothetical protein